jgi:restriction system protein
MMKVNSDDQHAISRFEQYTRSNEVIYVAEIQHEGLGTFKIIKDRKRGVLAIKIDAQFKIWDDRWAKIISKSEKESEKEASLTLASERTDDAQKAQKEIEDLLIHALGVDDTIDWETLIDKSKFEEPNPKKELDVSIEILKSSVSGIERVPREPNKSYYEPEFNIFDKIFKSLKQKRILEAEASWQKRLDEWKTDMAKYQIALNEFEKNKEELINKFNQLELDWKQKEIDFYKAQYDNNVKIEELRKSYLKNDHDAVLEYCELVLNNSIYPDSFPKDFELEYNPETKLLIVEYVLPSPDCFPNLIEVKYIATKKEIREIYLSESQLFKIYDSAIYKILLRTIHELFEADQSNSIEAIVFNGWVNAINRATGKIVNNCIVSIQVNKSEFNEIELSNIDPKTCFKSLKGIGSSKLSGIIAIRPIVQINKNDKRFVTSQEVTDKLNEGSNLAIMDWQDFEHLIREIFEKEFSSNGGEVKVTQASRDGGVDAIAFDPDPIRGGKIVIQAKRYTNTVGVAAVRDLYGTVVNEGATKGILVTTTDYGPDAYNFAKSKPLTLMNGANLLYLLEKHGHKARIDIAEAKRLQIQND